MNTNGYILIIEDSKTQAGQLEAILKPLGYPISIAYNGKDALTHLEKACPCYSRYPDARDGRLSVVQTDKIR